MRHDSLPSCTPAQVGVQGGLGPTFALRDTELRPVPGNSGWGVVLLTGLAMTAMQGCAAPALPPQGDRIVSVDYCADQMLLGLVDRHRIAAVSVDAATDPSFAAPLATGLPRVTPRIEAVLALKPTLVVRSYGGGPGFAAALERAGVRVVSLPPAERLADVDAAIAAAGVALGAETMAAQRRDDLAAALQNNSAATHGPALPALYLTPGDVTSGTGGMIDDLLSAGGFAPYVRRDGWHSLPIEQITRTKPRLVVRAFFDSAAYRQDRWSSSGHVALRRALAGVPSVTVAGGEVACGNWLIARPIRALRAARTRLS